MKHTILILAGFALLMSVSHARAEGPTPYAQVNTDAAVLLEETQSYAANVKGEDQLVTVDGDYAAAIAALAQQAAQSSDYLRSGKHEDEDLACILDGIAKDLPKRLQAMQIAKTPAEQDAALREMSRLLDDSVVVTE